MSRLQRFRSKNPAERLGIPTIQKWLAGIKNPQMRREARQAIEYQYKEENPSGKTSNQYQIPEIISKDFPKDIYTVIWVLKKLGFTNKAISRLSTKLPVSRHTVSVYYKIACRKFKGL